MTTSLISGSPRRETCTQGPVSTRRPFFSRTSAFRRRAADHTPITERGSAGSVGSNPPRVTSVFGTESAIVWTLKPLRSEEHTSELQSLRHLVCRLLLEKKKKKNKYKI